MKPYSRSDVKLAFNRRVMWMGNGALGALKRLAAWSNDNGTDGIVDEALVRTIASPEEYEKLRTVPPWKDGDGNPSKPSLEDTETPGSFFIHDFFDWNDPAAKVEAAREAKVRAGKARAEQARSEDPSTCSAPAPARARAPAPAEPQQPGVGVGVGVGVGSPPEKGDRSPREAEPDRPPRPPHERYAVAYAEGQELAGANGYPVPDEPRYHGDLAKLALHFQPARGAELETAIRDASRAFRAARPDAAKYTAGWCPRACLEWLRGGRPADTGPPSSGVFRRPTLLQQPAKPGEFNWVAARAAREAAT